MQIKINNASFGYDGENILENFSFEVNLGDKIAIIGRNGCGKTTLLKIITGEIELHQPDNTAPVFQKTGKPVIGSLKQMTFDDENVTLLEEITKSYSDIIALEEKLNSLQKELETNYTDKKVETFSRLHDEFERLGGYSYKSELASIISSFGFSETDKQKKLCEFSGGQRTKIAFIKLILSKPDILLLDEPTNHLDIKAINWLEDFISSYKKSVIIVSHDRAFLDNTVNVVYEITHKKLTKYIGNYSKFLETKEANYESQLKMYEAQQREIADIEAFIERFRYKATKAPQVQSRIKMLEKMEIIPPPEKQDNRAFKSKIKPEVESGNEVLSCVNLKIGYNGEPLACINLNLTKGERLGVIGGNGLGKSTFLNVLNNKLAPISGHFKFGYNVQIGYFEQISSKSSSSKTIYEEFSDEFPKLNDREIRSSLGAFLFSGNDVNKKMCSLSGGELVRLSLCKILERKPNVLILDEPTNHLDITSKETLENLLLSYTETIIFVSHDRYFTNKIATKLLIFEPGEAKVFEGTYHEYAHPNTKKIEEITKKLVIIPKKEKVDYPIDYDDPKEADPLLSLSKYELGKEKSRTENLLAKTETKSADAENKLKKLSDDFVDPEIASDFVKLMEIQAEMEKTQKDIDKFAEDWMTLSEKLTLINSLLEKQDELSNSISEDNKNTTKETE